MTFGESGPVLQRNSICLWFFRGWADPWPFTPICTVWLNNTWRHVRLKLATPRSRVEPPRIRIKLLKSFKSYLSLHRSGKISWTIFWDFHILGPQKHQRHWSACAKKISWLISEPVTTEQITKATVLWSAIKLRQWLLTAGCHKEFSGYWQPAVTSEFAIASRLSPANSLLTASKIYGWYSRS